MTRSTLRTLAAAAVLSAGLAGLGCDKEVSHTEKDSPQLFGGTKHEETTVTQHPDGTTSTEKSSSKTP